MSNPFCFLHARRAGTVLAAGFAFAAVPAVAQASAVNLGTAAPFVVLGGSAVTNTGPSVLNGDLGVAPGTALTGFALPAVVNGATHDNDAVAGQAQSDLTTASNVAAAQPVTANLTGQDLGGLTLTAGAYRYDSSAQLTGQVTLDAAGDPNAQFVFEVGSTLTTASASSVLLVDGASPCNVYWQIGSSATIGTTTAFEGNLMALTSITLNHGATVQGRALASTGAVTLDDNVIDGSMCGTPTTPPADTTPPVGSTPGSGTTPPPDSTPTFSTTPGGAATGTGSSTSASGAGSKPAGSSSSTGSTPKAGAPPASRSRVPTRKGTATEVHITSSPPEACTTGFTAKVRGSFIKRVVFTLGGKIVASRTGPLFQAYVPARSHGSVKARVTFKDATHAKTLTFAYHACAAAILHPRRGPSKFTG